MYGRFVLIEESGSSYQVAPEVEIEEIVYETGIIAGKTTNPNVAARKDAHLVSDKEWKEDWGGGEKMLGLTGAIIGDAIDFTNQLWYPVGKNSGFHSDPDVAALTAGRPVTAYVNGAVKKGTGGEIRLDVRYAAGEVAP